MAFTATDIKVEVTDETVISALNTPGGAVFAWRDDTAEKILQRAFETSPVNHILNARHRKGQPVGTYKIGWAWDRVGSNGHRVRATVVNVTDHAQVVEYGRQGSFEMQRFSWTEATVMKYTNGHPRFLRRPGMIKWYHHTYPRPGQHILTKATNVVMHYATGGDFTPIPRQGLL